MLTHNRVAAGLGAVLVILLLNMAKAGEVTPVKADTFVDSIGVNYYVDAGTKLGVGGLSYAQAYQDLQELGVRHVRSVLWGSPPTYSMYNDLNASLGVKFTFAQGYQDPSAVPGLVAKYSKNLNPGVVEGLEGVNEPDVFDPIKSVITSQGMAAGAQMVYNFQQALYTNVKSDPVLHDVPVLAPPLSSSSALAQSLASLDIEQYADYANAHPYPKAGSSSDPAPPDINTTRTNRIALAQTTAPDRPIIATETNTTGSTMAAEPSEGIYAPRLFLANFQSGCQRSYYYSLVNYNDKFPPLFGTKGQTNFTTPNPEAYAIMHMIGPGGILQEPQPDKTFDVSDLNFTLSDEYNAQSNPNGVASELFQKSDGTYRLALWRPSYYASNLAAPDVTLTLPGEIAAEGINLYTNLDSPNMTITSLAPAANMNIPVGARVVFVGIVPEPASLGLLGLSCLLLLRRGN